MKHNRDVCQGRSHSASSYGYGTAMRCPQECQPPPPKLPQTCSRGVQMTTPVVSMCQAPSCLKPSSPRPRPPPEPVVESDESDNGSLYCCQPSCCAPVCCEPACCETVDCDSDEGQQIYPRSQCRPPRSPPDQQQQNDCECSLVSSQCRQRDNTLPLSLQCPFDPNVRNTKKIKKKRKCRPCVWVVTHEMGVNTDNPCFVDEEVQADSGMGEETAVVRVGGVTKQETETKHRSGEREIDVTEVQEFTIFPNDGSRPQTDVITTNKVTKIMPSGETFVLGSVMSQTHFEEDEGTTEEILNKTKGALDSLDPSLNQQVVESMKSGLRTQVPISGNASRRSSDPAQRMGQSIATVSATASRRPSNPTAKINQAKTALSEMERAATPSFSGPPSAGASRRGSDLCTKTSPGKNNLSTVVTPSSAVGSRRSSDHTQPNYHREMSGRSSPPKNYDYDPVKTRKVKVTEVTSSALAGASRSSATKSGGAAAIPRSTKTKRKLLLDEKLPLQ
ncbi:hypothetical protein KR009_010969 [Drosophila setifemur]|nr:hypothetical protein KR009_010969 [Drosophila setifemur]